jgi:hypothetical protein
LYNAESETEKRAILMLLKAGWAGKKSERERKGKKPQREFSVCLA